MNDYVEVEDKQAREEKLTFAEIGAMTRQTGIREVLKQWGRWACCRFGTEYPKHSAGIKGAPMDDDFSEPCCDEMGMVVDKAVCSLKVYDPYAYLVIFHYYVKNYSQKTIATGAKKSETWVRQMQQNGEAYLAGMLLKDVIFEA